VHNYPSLCRLTFDGGALVAVVICTINPHGTERRGYIAMLAVESAYRKRGIARKLVEDVVMQMREEKCTEVVLETEGKTIADVVS
jgi:N-alpha-acetyltransferase 30